MPENDSRNNPEQALRLQAGVYSTPPSYAKFSWEFFHDITFLALTDLQFPLIAPPGTIQSFAFEPEVPLTAASTLILPDEVIPPLTDLAPILNRLEEEYICGNRSVKVQLKHSGKPHVFHFQKVCRVS
jgi:hypothetical protein